MTVSDDVNKTTSTYFVTRDSYVISGTETVKGSDGNAQTLFVIQNVPFEPKSSEGDYTAVPFNYPNEDGERTDYTAYALRQDGKPQLDATASPFSVEIGQRKKDDVASGVMIHVGGRFTDKDGNGHIAGSFGCFGVFGDDGEGGGDNIHKLAEDIAKRQAEQVVYKKDANGHIIKKNGKPVIDKNFGTTIRVKIQKRNPTIIRKSFKVDQNERIQKE
jgi:hypothetical protein